MHAIFDSPMAMRHNQLNISPENKLPLDYGGIKG